MIWETSHALSQSNLLCIYNTGSRTGLIDALTEMRGHLEPDEAELRS